MSYADLILHSNAVFTSLTDEPFKGAVAIRGKKILAVGTIEEVEEYAGVDTRIIDCGDRLVMPGLNDSHVHLMMGAVQSDEDHCLSVIDCTTRTECFTRIKAYAEAHPDNSWLFCWGFINAFWTDDPSDPTCEELDALVSDRPMVMADAGMHTSCLNTIALKAIGAFEAAAEGNCFVRVGEDGKPTGIVNEEFSQAALIAANSMTTDEASEVVCKLIPKLNSLGITAVSDMYPFLIGIDGVYDIYSNAVEDKGGSLRITFNADMRDLEGLKKYRNGFQGDYVRFGSSKYVLDGTIENGTGFVHEPYLNGPSKGSVWEPNCSPEKIKAMVEDSVANGMGARIHAIGDAAATLAVDAMEEAISRHGSENMNFAVEHLDTVRIEDLDRMAKLGISAAVQPVHSIFGGLDGYFQDLIGEDRASKMWRYRDMIDHGVNCGLGTDWPCAGEINPFVNLYAAVARTHVSGQPVGGWFSELSMTMAEALRNYTIGSARVEGFGDRIGTLEPGKYADIVVMDRNPFEHDATELKDMHAVLTVFDGRIVYTDSEGIDL